MKTISLVLLLLCGSVGAIRAADVDVYAVTKAQSFTQTSVAAPILLPTGGFAFASVINAHASGSVLSTPTPTLTLPNLIVKNFGPVPGVGSLAVAQTFDNEVALDLAFGTGPYRFTFVAATDGLKTLTLNLPFSSYPSTPTITNFTAAQNIDWTQNFTLTWAAFVNGGFGDNIQLTIRRKNGTQLFATPAYGSTGALDGTATSVVIPANTFVPGETYTATLYFGKIVNVDYLSYGFIFPPVPGVTAFIKTTEFPMKAPGTKPTLVISRAAAPDTYNLRWNADLGRTYDLVWSSDFVAWTRLFLVTATATTETRSDTPPVGAPARFYRLQEPP